VAGACTTLVSDSVVSTMARSARTGSSEDQGKREASPGQENTQQGRCVLSRSLDVMADPSVHPSDPQTTKALLKGGEVGAGGVEPPAPSVSANNGEALCYPPFPQVGSDRKGSS